MIGEKDDSRMDFALKSKCRAQIRKPFYLNEKAKCSTQIEPFPGCKMHDPDCKSSRRGD